MIWPFRRTERRSYTDAVLATLYAQAENGEGNYRSTSAAAAAAGLYSRAMAAATVDSVDRTGLDPAVMADIGRGLILDGEAVWLISVGEGMVRLIRASSWTVHGDGPDPDTWRYRLTVQGPTGMRTVDVPGAGVFHPRVNVEPSTPHQGRSPLQMAGPAALMLANLEASLRDETGAPAGNLLPAPLDRLDDENALRGDLRAIKGRSLMVPSMAGGWGMDGGRRQASDWRQTRLGAEPPEVLVTLRKELFRDVLSLCGVPPAMAVAGTDATGAREAFRQFLFAAVAPLSEIVRTEARAKLWTGTGFDFQSLNAADLQGRARAFKSLVDGGMALTDAAAASGILQPED